MNRTTILILIILFAGVFVFVYLKSLNYNKSMSNPKVVEAVIYDGIKYTAPHFPLFPGDDYVGGHVQAYSVATGAKLWDVEVYPVRHPTYDSGKNEKNNMEDVFITKLYVEDGKLVVLNQKNQHFTLDPKTGNILPYLVF